VIWQRLVVLPDILVTSAASPNPSSRSRWQKFSSPVSEQIRPVAPVGSWQSGERFLSGEVIEAETEYQNRSIKKPRVNHAGLNMGRKN
jgi:hypothetical protein